MKVYFVFMLCPVTQLFYNIGDFFTLEEAEEYANKTNYITKIKLKIY